MTDNARAFTETLLAALAEAGFDAQTVNTGGGCMAVEIDLGPAGDGYRDVVLLSDGDAHLPDGLGGWAGRYRGDEDPDEFLCTEEPTAVQDFVDAALRATADLD